MTGQLTNRLNWLRRKRRKRDATRALYLEALRIHTAWADLLSFFIAEVKPAIAQLFTAVKPLLTASTSRQLNEYVLAR